MGKEGEKYTDSELEETVHALTVLADLVIDNYLLRQRVNKPINQTDTQDFKVNLTIAKQTLDK